MTTTKTSSEIEDVEMSDIDQEEESKEVPVVKKPRSKATSKPKVVKKTTTKKVRKTAAIKKKIAGKMKKTIKRKIVRKGKKSNKKKQVKKPKVPLIKLSETDKPRFFKLLSDDESSSKGRFSGFKPKQAANKALTSIIKTMVEKGETAIGVDIHFTLKECTRWNRKKYKKGVKDMKTGETPKKVEKKYHYTGKRELLKNEIIVDHKQEDTDEKIMTTGKIDKEVAVKDGVTKYYMSVKNDGVTKQIVVKRIAIVDAKGKLTGKFNYMIVNEIKYKYTNKVQKEKQEVSVEKQPKKPTETKPKVTKKVTKKATKVEEPKVEDAKVEEPEVEESKVDVVEKPTEPTQVEKKVTKAKSKKTVAGKQ